MFGLSITHALIVVTVAVVLFKRNAVSDFLGDIGKGFKEFKQGLADAEDAASEIKRIERK